METQYFKEYSPALGREMECKLYGHAGRPMLFIPCQDGRFFDFENYHMAGTLAPWIESGQLMVLSIDTMDKETWSDKTGDPYWRIRRYEQWLDYIVQEACPMLQRIACERNGWDSLPGIIPFGCSLGATHVLNLYLRHPDLFDGCLALSGIYTASYGFDGYMDELRPGRLGAARHHLADEGDLRAEGHPRLGGHLGQRRLPRLALVVQAGDLLHAPSAGLTDRLVRRHRLRRPAVSVPGGNGIFRHRPGRVPAVLNCEKRNPYEKFHLHFPQFPHQLLAVLP